MRDVTTALLALTVIALEVTLWVENPMHISAVFLPARAFGLEVFREQDSSMKPTIAPGRYVLVTAWAYWKRDPRAGDVVAFQYPLNPSLADVKRIVAAGGSTVEVREGIAYVDGKPFPGPVLQPYVTARASEPDMPAIRVPLGSYFVMGDDPRSSEDSRYYGVIKRSRIIGQAVWPRRSALDAHGRANEMRDVR